MLSGCDGGSRRCCAGGGGCQVMVMTMEGRVALPVVRVGLCGSYVNGRRRVVAL